MNSAEGRSSIARFPSQMDSVANRLKKQFSGTSPVSKLKMREVVTGLAVLREGREVRVMVTAQTVIMSKNMRSNISRLSRLECR